MEKKLTYDIELYRRQVFGLLDLNPKQQEALQVLNDQTTETLIFGGAALGGKTWIGCEWLLWSCLAYPETRWFIGREELKRLRESTLITFQKVCKKNQVGTGIYKYNGQDHYIQFENGSRIDLLELKYLPSDPLYERYGSTEFTGGFIEEGGEVDFAAFDTLKSRIGRQHNDRYGLKAKILVTANPKKNWLYNNFVKPALEGILPSKYRFIQSLATDNHKRDKGSLEALESITDPIKLQRLRYGIWEYDTSDNALFKYTKIGDMYSNFFVKTGKKYISADIARLGKDNTVIGVWDGLRLIEIAILSKVPTDVSAYTISQLAEKHKVARSGIVIDVDGVGGGVADQLKGCVSFVNNSTPLVRQGKKENYQNLKSQCYFGLAELMNTNSVFIDPLVAQKEWLGKSVSERLGEELQVIKRKNPDGDGKLAVNSKDEMKQLLGRSPDLADMVMMRIYFEMKPQAATYRFSI
ncbi:MAG: terminase family protein [Bacteroidota bacterium]